MFPYKILAKKDTLKTNKTFYYATSIKMGSLGDVELLQRLSERTKLHPIDCQRLLLHLAELMADTLIEGKTVTLPEIGTFRATLSSKGVEDPKDFKTDYIKALKVAFLPHKKMQIRLKRAQFKKVRE
jgi:predicted histone-like DNA-binding protein